MKKILSFFLLFFLAVSNVFGQEAVSIPKPKLSPLTQQYLFEVKKNNNGAFLPSYVYKKGNDGKMYISALIKVNAGVKQSNLTLLGVHINTKAGNIWTAQIPLENVEAFTTLPGIDYIQLDEPIVHNLDSLRVATRVDSVQAGYGLPMPYNGDGVIVADVDAGFDYGHPELFDTTGKSYRVKRVWEQQTTGTPPTGFSYGNEMTDSTAMWAKGTDGNGSHGTHVTGICAGSGYGSIKNRLYRGVAYKSDIVLVAISPDSLQWVNTGVSDIIDGVNYVYQYASSVNKPAVVNLSWGSPLGPHDGTSLFGLALDNLTGPGKIFVCSAGNNGKDSIHTQKTFTPTDTLLQTFINITNTPGGNRTWVDIWGDTGKTFCVAVTLYSDLVSGNTTGYICLDNTIHHAYVIGSNNDTCFAEISTSSADFNGKPRIFISFYSRVTDSILISVKGTDGNVNMFDSYVYGGAGYYSPFKNYGQTWATNGDTRITISDIASTKSAITVGAFVTKLTWYCVNGAGPLSFQGNPKKGYLAFFSSKGPNADGAIKPDISAPGFTIMSGGSSYDPGLLSTGGDYPNVVRNYYFARAKKSYPFVTFVGTSMAAPAVTGIAALLLQVNPNLNPQSLKNILITTAIQDTFTHVLPSAGVPDWGHGKVNAYAAVKEALKTAGINPVSAGTLNCDVFPNPNSGVFTLNYSSNNGDKVNIQAYDMLGHLVAADNWSVAPGNNTKELNFSGLSKGIYFIKLSSPAGYSAIKILVE